MSLNYDFREVKDFDALHEDEAQRAINDALVWATMWVDIGHITEDNWQEFATRIHMWETTFSPHLIDGDGEAYYIKPSDVKRRIGLRTNVSQKTTNQYRTKIAKAVQAEAEGWVNRQLRED